MRKSVFSDEYARVLAAMKNEREKRHITQEELAKRLNVAQTFVSKCERGERRLDVVELRWFCQAMGVSIVKLIREAGLDRTD
jgi:transcriptional regulator with XRE-family HTH domain